MDAAAELVTDYPSKSCAKAEKAILDALKKTRELRSLLPEDWLPDVYACILFPLPPDQGVPPHIIPYLEAVASEYTPYPQFTRIMSHAMIKSSSAIISLHPRLITGRYLHARLEGTSMTDLISKASEIAATGRMLAQHTPLLIKESVSGAFGDAFFSKHAVSSEKDAKKTRSDIETRACSVYSTFDGKFNQCIGSLRLHSVTIKEAVPPKIADFKESSGNYPLHNEDMLFKACIHDAKAPDVTDSLWFPVPTTSISKSDCHGFAILRFEIEDFELQAYGNHSRCTHLHLHGFVKHGSSKSVRFIWSMPLPNASISEVILEGYAQANLPSEKSYRTTRCSVAVRNTILMVLHPSSLKSDSVKLFGSNVCSYYLHFISMLMNYSGKPLLYHRDSSDLSIFGAALSANFFPGNSACHHGFASHFGHFLARQLRTRFCLPDYVSAAIELAVRVSNFVASRDMVADLLVSACSLGIQSYSEFVSSGSKFIDDLRKNSCVIAREFCLDIVSSFSTDLVIHEDVSPLVIDKVVVSAAVLLSVDPSDHNAAVESAVRLGVKRTCLMVMKRIKSEAHNSVVADLFRATKKNQPGLSTGVSEATSFDLFSKQAMIELRASMALCSLILSLLDKQRLFDSMVDQFTDQHTDGPWYSSLALDQNARAKLFQATRIIEQAHIPFKLILDLSKILSQRAKKLALMSFDDCSGDLWKFIAQFFNLRDALKGLQGFDHSCFDGVPDVFKEITCGTSQTSWLSRLAVAQEQKLQEAIVADELHSLVEVSYFGSRVYLWLTDFISVTVVMTVPELSVASSEFHSLLVYSYEQFWELLMIFVGKASIEILNLCAKELKAASSSESASVSFGLSTVVRGIGGGINAAINFLDPTAKDGETQRGGVFATIKQTAYNTARAVRQGKGVISAAAEATKGTVRTAFSAVASTANVVVQAGALVASGVDAAASGVAGAVTGAVKAVGLGHHPKIARDITFAASTGSIFFTISLIRAIEETIKRGVSSSQSMLSDSRFTKRSSVADIESILQINFQKQYVEPLCSEVCSQASENFQSIFSLIINSVLSGKHEIDPSWEIPVVKGVNAIFVNVPDVNPDPVLKLAAQDIFKGYVEVVFDQFCLAVARCKRELGARVNEQITLESIQEFSNKLAKLLDDFSQNDFDACAFKLVTTFRARISNILKMQFSLSKEDLLKMLQEMQTNQEGDVAGNQHLDLQIVLEHKFERDSKIQSFLESLKHRKWRSAFEIPESDIFFDSAAAVIQEKHKDRSKFITGMLYITHHHICFLEDIDFAKDRGNVRKQGTVDLGPIQIPASNARLRIQWVRGDNVHISPQDKTKIKVKGPLDAAMYQNSCILTNFRILHPEASSNTYLKCTYADQMGKSETLKVSKVLKGDPTRTNFGFLHQNGQEFSFDADLTGGGERSMLSVSVRNVAGLTSTPGSKRIVMSHSFNPNDLERGELREIRLSPDYEKDSPERQSHAVRHSPFAGHSSTVVFSATRNIRREQVPSTSSSGEIIIRLDQHKIQSVRHILSVRSGDGRRVENAASDFQLSAAAPVSSDENDTEVVEEGRFSCLYWNSQQSVKDAKLGTLLLTSDHISFQSSSGTLMGCFVYEIKKLERKGATNIILHSELEQHHFDSFTRFALTGAHKGNQRDCAIDILKKCYKQRFGDRELQVT